MAHLLPQQLLHGTLAQAEGHDVVGQDHLSGDAPQVRDHVAVQHGPHLKGWAGQHQHMDAIGLKGAAGSSSHRVVEYRAALRQLRLLDIVLRHLHMDILFKKGPNILQNVRMQHQGLAEGLTDGLLGQVVVGGAKTAGGDDDIRPLPGDVQRFLQPPGVVPHHGVPEDIDPQARQGFGQLLGVGVGDVAEEQLGAHGDDLCGV